MRKVVFDIETKNFFQDVGSNDPAKLDLSVVCIYDSETDSYRGFFENELKDLWPILEKTDLLIGYNSDHFDIPLLNKYYSGDLKKVRSLDLMKEIKNVIGRRIKLNTIANATLGLKKSGDGDAAVRWWRQGELQKLKEYCMDDVRITKAVYDFALQHGILKYREGSQTKEIKLDTSRWEQPVVQAMTHTLPF